MVIFHITTSRRKSASSCRKKGRFCQKRRQVGNCRRSAKVRRACERTFEGFEEQTGSPQRNEPIEPVLLRKKSNRQTVAYKSEFSQLPPWQFEVFGPKAEWQQLSQARQSYRDLLRILLVRVIVVDRDENDGHLVRTELPNELPAQTAGRDRRRDVPACDQFLQRNRSSECKTYEVTARPMNERIPSL